MAQLRKNRILIIDDNQDIHNDIKKILLPSSDTTDLNALVQNISGYSQPARDSSNLQIDSALQGDEGVAMVRQAIRDENPYALAFVDIRIPPGLDGVQTIKQLRHEDDRLQYVIITAYSDYSWETITTEISSGDNLLILKKPFESIEIRQCASALLEKWHLANEREEALAALLRSKKMETIGIMASGISHDFNNLLMGIMGNIELAALQLPQEHSANEFLENAINVVKTTKELINQFLYVTNHDSCHRQATSTRDLITGACNRVFTESNISCEVSLPDNLWLADVDPYQIIQVLCEIFKNAKEAMFKGGQVTVKAENIHTAKVVAIDKKRFIRITIHDQGCGIEKKDLSNIYDPYYSTKPRGTQKGMGLGLAIVAAIVRRHEGDIHIDSAPGRGTTVVIELPASYKHFPN